MPSLGSHHRIEKAWRKRIYWAHKNANYNEKTGHMMLFFYMAGKTAHQQETTTSWNLKVSSYEVQHALIWCVCVCWFVYLYFVRALRDTQERIQSCAGNRDGQSSYFWLKETHGSEPGVGGGGAPLREIQRLLSALYFPRASLSSLIIFFIWKCVFAVRVHDKTSLTVQRPKTSTTSDPWLLFSL